MKITQYICCLIVGLIIGQSISFTQSFNNVNRKLDSIIKQNNAKKDVLSPIFPSGDPKNTEKDSINIKTGLKT